MTVHGQPTRRVPGAAGTAVGSRHPFRWGRYRIGVGCGRLREQEARYASPATGLRRPGRPEGRRRRDERLVGPEGVLFTVARECGDLTR